MEKQQITVSLPEGLSKKIDLILKALEGERSAAPIVDNVTLARLIGRSRKTLQVWHKQGLPFLKRDHTIIYEWVDVLE